MNNILEAFPEGDTPRKNQNSILLKIQDAINNKEKFIIVQAPTGLGKAQPLSSKIRTPNGWSTMGELQVGDTIITPAGNISTITHVHPQHLKKIYRVSFKDGRYTRCCADHLWKIYSHNYKEGYRVIDTLELQRILKHQTYKPHIDLILPQAGEALPISYDIDPYVLGCLIGDGSMTQIGIRITSNDNEIINEMTRLMPSFCIKPLKKSKYGHSITRTSKTSKALYILLRELNLFGLTSDKKFIPDIYKRGSVQQRIDLIQGLLDTDGFVGKGGNISFCQTSKQLALDIIEIIRSIGGIAYISREYTPVCVYKGRKVNGKRAYNVTIRYRAPRDLLRLSRKRNRCSINYQYADLKLAVDSVTEDIDQAELCKCITIDDPQHLYITDDYIVTHNSHLAATIANISNHPSNAYTSLIDSHEIAKKDGLGNYIYENQVLQEPPFGCAVLTVSKALQDQYKDLFKTSEVLKGKQNYTCKVDEDFDCDLAPCLLTPRLLDECRVSNNCPYLNARRDALKNRFSVFNYSVFFHLPDFIKRREFFICDEASELEDELVNFYSCEINYSSAKLKTSKLIDDDLSTAHKWLTDVVSEINTELKSIPSILMKQKNKKRQLMNTLMRYRFLKNLQEKTSLVLENWYKAEYIVEYDTHKATFTPLYVNSLANNIFRNSDTVILMSATIIDHETFAKTLGIEKYKYIEVDSDFDPTKSPIYCSSKVSLNYQNVAKELPKVIDQALMICKHYKDNKGIVHTHTHSITQAFQEKVKNDNRFLMRDTGITNEHILYEHHLRDDPTVLISPSLGFGTDLKDDFGRFSIVMKAPFLPLGSKRIKKLAQKDHRWYIMKALTNLVQMCGRTTRTQEDYSDTFILDGTAVNLIKKNIQYLPKYFSERII